MYKRPIMLLSLLIVLVLVALTPSTLAQNSMENYKNTNLSEEYVNFLGQKGISIVDGNIQIDNADQLTTIAEHFFDVLKERGIFEKYEEFMEKDDPEEKLINITIKDIMDYILHHNLTTIKENVKEDLINNDLISYPIWKGSWISYDGLTGVIWRGLVQFALSYDASVLPIDTMIMFDARERKCAATFEAYLKTYIESGKVDGKFINGEVVCEKYMREYEEMAKFLNGKKSKLPYTLSKLSLTAEYTFQCMYEEQMMVYILSNGIAFSPKNTVIHDVEYVRKYIQPFFDSFPQFPE